MKDLQVAPLTAVEAEPATAANVSTKYEMAGAEIPHKAVDATTAAAANALREAATAVAAIHPNAAVAAVPPTLAELFMEPGVMVNGNKIMVGSASAFSKDDE